MIRKRTPLEREVDQELISKGKDVVKDFDESQALHVPAKQWDTKLISIRLPKWMILRLRELALQKGDMGYQRLIKFYLADVLSRPTQWEEMRPLERQGISEEGISSTSSSLNVELEALGKEFKVPTSVDVGVFNQTRR